MTTTPAEVRLGVITPSSNTNAEPATYRMLAELPWVSAHFSRFALPRQLDVTITAAHLEPAALLLAEAEVDALAFHGTSGSWRGVEGDRELSTRLTETTGIATTTATLATLAALEATAPGRVGLAFPGTEEIGRQIVAEYARHGVEIARLSCAEDVATNAQIAALPRDRIEALLDGACGPGIDAVVAIGTNLRAAPLVETAERRNGVVVVDSAVAVVWQLLRMTGVTARPQGWGRLLSG